MKTIDIVTDASESDRNYLKLALELEEFLKNKNIDSRWIDLSDQYLNSIKLSDHVVTFTESELDLGKAD